MTRRHRIVIFVVCAALSGLLWGGCSGDEMTNPASLPVMPPTPDAFMQTFAQTYTAMDLPAYGTLMQSQYEFKFLETGRNGQSWNRELDLASTESMFNGNPGELFDGLISCTGIDSIHINEFIRLTPWEDTGPDDPDFPDTERALYQIELVFYVDAGENSLTIASGQIFYLKGETVDKGYGDKTTGYRLCGQRDMRLTKANENLYWGDIKMMFLPEGNSRVLDSESSAEMSR